MAKKRIGILQPGRIGDIIICLPIAHYYHQKGFEVVWPIDDRFAFMFIEVAPWVTWMRVQHHTSPGRVWGARTFLKKQRLDQYLNLQDTSGIRDMRKADGSIIHFDELKYIKAQVPFEHKWKLRECVTLPIKNSENTYFQWAGRKKISPNRYVARHYTGSNWKVQDGALDGLDIPYYKVDIRPDGAASVWYWYLILERATHIICVDSCIANMVEGLCIDRPRTFITRSDKWLTPVLRPGWNVINLKGERVNPVRQYK